MRTQTTRVIGGRVNADGTSPTGTFSSRRAALGSYVLTFSDRLVSLSALPASGPVAVACYGNTGRSINVDVQLPATAAYADIAFTVTAVVAA